ncbi:hypothetical protein [Bacteroides heparinolyticus]|uniref:hypothetical protein n=1 Tax=Prevotella heparinolytica TaxID=28113 RepID=UPI003AF139A8
MKKGLRTQVVTVLLLVLALVASNRIYNHLSAWLGILAAALSISIFIYKQTKKKENENKKEN